MEYSTKHILIDQTNHMALARHDSRVCLAALALLQFANVDCHILRCGETKAYSRYSIDQLGLLIQNAGGQLPPPNSAYPTVIGWARGVIEAAPHLEVPFTEREVVRQLSKLAPNSDKAYAFTPGAEEPTKLLVWHLNPNVNRKREDCEQWVQFASGALFAEANGEAVVTVPSSRPAPARRVTPATPTGPATPRAPRPAGAASARPKAGTSTGTVWDIADEVSADYKDKSSSDCRKEVVRRCVAKGINKSTASVQYGKWLSSLPTAL